MERAGGFLREELGVDRVHRGEVVHGLQKDGGLDDKVQPRVGGFEYVLEVGQHLAGLHLDPAFNDGHGGGVQPDLPSGEDEVFCADGL
ncbi:MAG: hypothetical protein MZV64_24260 [Ignavibacteriales bacterium]|nr:hypothetical protein [Ignavibacteriales bacterium]